MVAGTPAWFAPEQFEAKKVTTAIDNFAAGSVLYFAATGKSPWGKEDTSVANTMHRILNKEAEMSGLIESQREVISLLHKKSPKERSTASEILARIELLSQGSVNELSNQRSPFSLKSKSGKAIAATLVTLVAGGAFYNYQFQPFSQKTSTTVSPSLSPIQVTKWSLKLVGDSEGKNGTGDSYSTFICDQGVVKESLQIRELTNPPASIQPTIKLFKGDARCGKDFDTILIEGNIDGAKKKRSYVLAGSTQTGFIIQYEFDITIKD